MPNPISLAWDTFAGLPDAIKAGGPVAIILAAAITTYITGTWMSGSACKALREADGGTVTELRLELANVTAEKNRYFNIAFKGVLGDEQAAKDSIKNVEQAAPAKPGEKPKAPIVVVKTQPVTASEKAAVEKPPLATDPKTLEQRQDTAQTVLRKVAPAGAQVQAVKKN